MFVWGNMIFSAPFQDEILKFHVNDYGAYMFSTYLICSGSIFTILVGNEHTENLNQYKITENDK